MQRATIVFNPLARNAPKIDRLIAAAEAMLTSGWQIDLLRSEGPGHTTVLAREAAAAGSSVVFGCGGDGTLNEVVNGIAGSEAALGVIRAGTGNVFGKEIGVPRSLERALHVLVDGEQRRFDLGRAGDRYFLIMASLGFDAHVVRRVPSRPKRVLGTTAYLLWGAASLPAYRPPRVRLSVDGDEPVETDMYWLLLGNTRSYGGVIDITSEALADDGELDAYLFSGQGLGWATAVGLRLLLRRQVGARGVTFRRLTTVDIETPGVPVQGDGEYFGETPMRFSVEKRALSVLLPPGGGRHLLHEEA